jgi:hypothetical protein
MAVLVNGCQLAQSRERKSPWRGSPASSASSDVNVRLRTGPISPPTQCHISPASSETVTPASVPAANWPVVGQASAVTLRLRRAATECQVVPLSVDRHKPSTSVPATMMASEAVPGDSARDWIERSPGRVSMARQARPPFRDRKRPDGVAAKTVWSTSKADETARLVAVRSSIPALPPVQLIPPSSDRKMPSCSVPTSTSWSVAKTIVRTRLPTSTAVQFSPRSLER